MQRPPRRRDERLVNYRIFIRSYSLIGSAKAILSFTMFFAVLKNGGWQWAEPLSATSQLHRQATATLLATISFCHIGNVLACRTNRQSALPYLRRFNRWIVAGVLVERGFIAAIISLPFLHRFFSTGPLPAWGWGGIILATLLIFALEDLRKWLVRHDHGWLAV